MIDLLKRNALLFFVSWIFLVPFHARAIVDPELGTTHKTPAKENDRLVNPILKDTPYGEVDLEGVDCPPELETTSKINGQDSQSVLIVTFDGEAASSRNRECFKNNRLDK